MEGFDYPENEDVYVTRIKKNTFEYNPQGYAKVRRIENEDIITGEPPNLKSIRYSELWATVRKESQIEPRYEDNRNILRATAPKPNLPNLTMERRSIIRRIEEEEEEPKIPILRSRIVRLEDEEEPPKVIQYKTSLPKPKPKPKPKPVEIVGNEPEPVTKIEDYRPEKYLLKNDDRIPKLLRKWDEENGTYDDIEKIYDQEGWREFYPNNENFFVFNAGNVHKVPQTILDNGEEIYEGDMNKNGEKHGFGTSITPQGLKRGIWRHNEFTGWNIESDRGLEGNPAHFKDRKKIYQGRFIDGKMEGFGRYNDPGNSFTGEFKNHEKLVGEEIKLRDNSIYNGRFKNNLRHGKGKVTLRNGELVGYEYEGDFEKGRADGKGTITWSNGDKYVGEVKNGKLHGKGVYNYYENGRRYEGEFKNGKKDGFGIYYLDDGTTFEGNFVDGREHGQCKRIFKNGTEQICEFDHGTMIKALGQN